MTSDSFRMLMVMLALGALGACTSPTTGGVINAPQALRMAGVPPIPVSLASRVGAYTEVRAAGLVDWHPDGQDLVVTWRGGNTVQLHRADPTGRLTALTDAAEPTRSGRFVPAAPDLLLLSRDSGGGEAGQIVRHVVSTGEETRLTDPDQRHGMGPFSRDGRWLAFTSVPLDRTAQGGSRARIETRLSMLDPASGEIRVLATLPGPGWSANAFGRDDRQLLLTRYRSNIDAEVWSLDLAPPAGPPATPQRLLPRDGDPRAAYFGADVLADGRLLVRTDAFGEFRSLFRFDPATGAFDRVGPAPTWDVVDSNLAADGARLALVRNEAGRGVLHLADGRTLAPMPAPDVPGNVRGVRFSPDGTRLAIWHDGADTPGTVSVLDLASGQLAVRVRPDTAGLDTAAFRPTEVIEWTSFDGLRITGLMTRPPARFTGPRPVLIDFHGGPAAQARLGFNGRYNYLINELGIVLIEPNVRGSSGFGKTFVSLDDRRLREDSVRDAGALLDWIATQPGLDASRVAVSGGSYGGYMVQAVAVHFGARIRGAINSVGISHFVNFLENTESYRRDLRRVEYGDERDPAMRAFLQAISPLTQAARIKAPMFVIHGRNDPRVPVSEAEQLVSTLQGHGVPVWTMIADNEGHGFAKKENADYAFLARVLFLEQVLR
jgi:dipeptidyl aminopeptidase/acylaminoacyl peptidase